MYQVIICTISTGRIQRKTFNDMDAAWKCADAWSEKNVKSRTYTVTVEHAKAVAAPKQTGRSAGM
jgi:hypothetical protein